MTAAPQIRSVSAGKLAALCDVDRKTIAKWMARTGAGVPTPGGQRRIPLMEAAALLTRLGLPVPPEIQPFARVPLPSQIRTAYVAGPSAEIDRCDRFARAARALGIEISHEWQEQHRAGVNDATMGPACLAGVAAADVTIAIAPSPAGDTTIGTWAEMGAALALRKPVVIVADPEHRLIPFESLCFRLPPKHAIAALRFRRPRET